MGPLLRLLGFILLWLVILLITLGLGLIFLVPYCLLVFLGQETRAAKANSRLQSAVMNRENVLHSAMQQRLVSLTSRRQLVAITDSRILVIARGLFGGFSMQDYQWKDLHDAQLSENVLPQWFGSRIEFHAASGFLMVDGVPSELASSIYREAQHQEQAWEEKRRVRALEEARAAAGGIVMNGGGGAGVANDARMGASLDELEKAKRLLDSGVISDAEYHEIKAKILSRAAS